MSIRNLTFFFLIDVSSKNLDANERGYALIGKPEDMHTWFFLYDETMRVETEAVELHNLNATYSAANNYAGGHANPASNKRNVDMSASLSVPNLDQSDIQPPQSHNYNYFPGNMHHYVPPAPMPAAVGGVSSHQQQAQHNFMKYGHAQSVHGAAPPSPPLMDGHAHHGPHCNAGGLSQHHSRSVPSVAAAVASAAGNGGHTHGGNGCVPLGGTGNDPYASRTSLNHEINLPGAGGSSSRPQSRSHSHHCHHQGCDYPSG